LTKFLGDLRRPCFAATTARVTVHDDVTCRHRRCGEKGKGKQIFAHVSNLSILRHHDMVERGRKSPRLERFSISLGHIRKS
jgi:hypothetical protein